MDNSPQKEQRERKRPSLLRSPSPNSVLKHILKYLSPLTVSIPDPQKKGEELREHFFSLLNAINKFTVLAEINKIKQNRPGR